MRVVVPALAGVVLLGAAAAFAYTAYGDGDGGGEARGGAQSAPACAGDTSKREYLTHSAEYVALVSVERRGGYERAPQTDNAGWLASTLKVDRTLKGSLPPRIELAQFVAENGDGGSYTTGIGPYEHLLKPGSRYVVAFSAAAEGPGDYRMTAAEPASGKRSDAAEAAWRAAVASPRAQGSCAGGGA
jgi:hypothetical protein